MLGLDNPTQTEQSFLFSVRTRAFESHQDCTYIICLSEEVSQLLPDLMSIRRTCKMFATHSIKWCILCASLVCLGAFQIGCSGDPCQQFFQGVKSRCRLGSSAEGVKLDEFLNQKFRACQLDLCSRTNINTINCADPDTHIPGGQNGRFLSCQ